jgi:hypothetical protein
MQLPRHIERIVVLGGHGTGAVAVPFGLPLGPPLTMSRGLPIQLMNIWPDRIQDQLQKNVMKKRTAWAILCLAVLAVSCGCSVLGQGKPVSGTSWSQIAAHEEQEQRLNDAPQGDWRIP